MTKLPLAYNFKLTYYIFKYYVHTRIVVFKLWIESKCVCTISLPYPTQTIQL